MTMHFSTFKNFYLCLNNVVQNSMTLVNGEFLHKINTPQDEFKHFLQHIFPQDTLFKEGKIKEFQKHIKNIINKNMVNMKQLFLFI